MNRIKYKGQIYKRVDAVESSIKGLDLLNAFKRGFKEVVAKSKKSKRNQEESAQLSVDLENGVVYKFRMSWSRNTYGEISYYVLGQIYWTLESGSKVSSSVPSGNGRIPSAKSEADLPKLANSIAKEINARIQGRMKPKTSGSLSYFH